MAKGAGEWKEQEPLSASKLNANDKLNIREIRVGPGLGIQRNPGGNATITLDNQDRPWPLLRVKLTTMPESDTPQVAGVTRWDGTNILGAELYAKIKGPHALNDDFYICRPSGGTDQIDPNGVPVVWVEFDVVLDCVVKITGAPTSSDPAGEYLTARIMTGSATGMPPAGMTDPGVDNAVIENTGEQEQANHAGKAINPHALRVGMCFPGMIVGQTSDTPPKSRVVICAPNPYAVFPVTLYSDSGSGGDGSTKPSWTYQVTDYNSNVIGTMMTPLWAREIGNFAAATNGDCFYSTDGSLVLFRADEVPNTNACTPTPTPTGSSTGSSIPLGST